ncbi:phospholipase A2 inhibitor CNF-like [Sphaeramia orbicularis]|uniref:phospholipase A2 inhibitor CNF-like n=1 Tax=Sphaeramia orbicularis TaxID=375764 RepID=UPI00117D7665|nr:phospholipase A2 inhibitor CNF-like [Sphaeramia orbicularis]
MKIPGIWQSNMYLILLISGILLFPKGKVFTYFNREGILQLQGTVKTQETIFKGCASLEQCAEGSFSVDHTRFVINRLCCGADLCNDIPTPGPDAPIPNGKKCITCNGTADCTDSLDCVNNEDHCFSKTVNQGSQLIYFKGCASKDVC